jgi:hypothetical protein
LELAAAAMYAELEQLRDSLERALAAGEDKQLRRWYEQLEQALRKRRQQLAQLEQVGGWLEGIRAVLAKGEVGDEGRSRAHADEVARELAGVLGQIADEQGLSEWQEQVRGHILGVSERYWSGLFVCYEKAGVPRTNNEMENLFRGVRQGVRRRTGFKNPRRVVQRQGAWLVYKVEESPAELKKRLAAVDAQRYKQEWAHYKAWQQHQGWRNRWRRHGQAVLAELEAQWTSLSATYAL